MIHAFVRMAKDESGVSATEYALLLGVVGSAVALGGLLLGNSISGAMNAAANTIEECSGSTTC
jgi:pilus assembly protein Flp/PilA